MNWKTIAHSLLGLADFSEFLIDKFRDFAQQLLEASRSEPRQPGTGAMSARHPWPGNTDLLEIALRAYVPTRRGPNKWRGSQFSPIRMDPHFRLRDHDGRGSKR